MGMANTKAMTEGLAGVREWVRTTQESRGYPPEKMLDDMVRYFGARPLCAFDDNAGYVFWMIPDSDKVVPMLDELVRVAGAYDETVGKLVALEAAPPSELEAENTVLRAKVARLSMRSNPEPEENPSAPKPPSDGKSKGQIAYEARVNGLAWDEIGGKAALMAAKRHAKANSLPWPVPAPVPSGLVG